MITTGGGFDAWMAQLDDELRSRCGFGSSDLTDYAYRDAYDAEQTPDDVASEVLVDNFGGDDGSR